MTNFGMRHLVSLILASGLFPTTVHGFVRTAGSPMHGVSNGFASDASISTTRSSVKSPFTPNRRQQRKIAPFGYHHHHSRTISTSTSLKDAKTERTSRTTATQPFQVEDFFNGESATQWVDKSNHQQKKKKLASMEGQRDPSQVEIVDSRQAFVKKVAAKTDSAEADTEDLQASFEESGGSYPFALMMKVSAPYIAAHAGQLAVFHIPGELLGVDRDQDHAKKQATEQLLSDIALAWILGMKIVMVVGCQGNDNLDTCPMEFDRPHECQNTLRVVDENTLRLLEEEAGYLRTEVERRLNRCLRRHGSGPGNVVSGNFYDAKQFGTVRGQDFEHTGFCSKVNTDKIHRILKNDDVIMLTTVGLSRMGELVHVNGYHLTAVVAAALQAYKVFYLSLEGAVLRQKESSTAADAATKAQESSIQPKLIQELPLSFAKDITDYHQVHVHDTGFATFDKAHAELEPRAVELLLHLGWASWAVQNGVTRAHIVNPTDGALLEELFTNKNGANTCLYHDRELLQARREEDEDDAFRRDDGLDHEPDSAFWDNYFDGQGRAMRTVAAFG